MWLFGRFRAAVGRIRVEAARLEHVARHALEKARDAVRDDRDEIAQEFAVLPDPVGPERAPAVVLVLVVAVLEAERPDRHHDVLVRVLVPPVALGAVGVGAAAAEEVPVLVGVEPVGLLLVVGDHDVRLRRGIGKKGGVELQEPVAADPPVFLERRIGLQAPGVLLGPHPDARVDPVAPVVDRDELAAVVVRHAALRHEREAQARGVVPEAGGRGPRVGRIVRPDGRDDVRARPGGEVVAGVREAGHRHEVERPARAARAERERGGGDLFAGARDVRHGDRPRPVGQRKSGEEEKWKKGLHCGGMG